MGSQAMVIDLDSLHLTFAPIHHVGSPSARMSVLHNSSRCAQLTSEIRAFSMRPDRSRENQHSLRLALMNPILRLPADPVPNAPVNQTVFPARYSSTLCRAFHSRDRPSGSEDSAMSDIMKSNI